MKGLADRLTTQGKLLVDWNPNKEIKIFLCPGRLSGKACEIKLTKID